MFLLSLTSKFNKALAPFLLRHGLTLRFFLDRGVVRDNPTLDALLLIPVSQRILSIEVHHESLSKQKPTKQPSALDKAVEKIFDAIFGPDKKDTNNDHVHAASASQTTSSTKNSTSLKMNTLERYLRPILVPNEQWSDVERWMFHSRFLKFARAEFLKAKYDLKGVLERYPKIRQSPQLNKPSRSFQILSGLTNNYKHDHKFHSTMLPSSTTIRTAFDMTHWTTRKDSNAVYHRMKYLITQELNKGELIHVPNTTLCVPMIPPTTNIAHLSLEDILELAGGHVASCGVFNVLCEENDIFQLWTKDYIDGLAKYLKQRSSSSSSSSTVILDVGAGDGLLAQLLRESFATMKHDGPEIIATDDGSWKIPTKCPVLSMSVADAVKTYTKKSTHVIVLCSWMPMGQDWTSIFREHQVDEYILIGEYDDGNCGDNWTTWGNPDFKDTSTTTSNATNASNHHAPPYGGYYTKSHLTQLASHHFSRFDSADSTMSATISFRKIPSKQGTNT